MRLTTALYKPILLRTAIVTLPSAALLGAGQLTLSAWYFYLSLSVVLLADVFRHKHLECIAAAIACSPMMILLRGDLFYSGPEVVYALAIFQAPLADLKRLFRNRLAAGLIIGALVYWLASFAYSGNYSSNFRAVELAFAASLFYLLATHRIYLLPALLGLACATVAEGFALLANGAMTSAGGEFLRLGLASIEGRYVGNPISFGILTALAFLLTISGGGRWLGLSNRPKERLAIQVLSAAWLVLSTSRGSWLVALAGAIIIAWTERRQRQTLLVGAVLLVAIGAVLSVYSSDNTLISYIDKTFSADTSIDKLTTGRSEQWASFPAAWSDAPLFGHGPGSSLMAGRQYFEKNLIYHALFLQIGVETGTFGLVCLFVFFYVLFASSYRYFRLTGDPIALIGAVGYFIVGLTVPALDAASATFLGIALVGGDLSNLFVVPCPTAGAGVYARLRPLRRVQAPSPTAP
jgi:O-antigen ligase